MGYNLTKLEKLIILMVLIALVAHTFVTNTIHNIDTVAFFVFVAMCFSGYFTLRAAKDIVEFLEEKNQASYNMFKKKYSDNICNIAPIAFGSQIKFSKYVSLNRNLKMVS